VLLAPVPISFSVHTLPARGENFRFWKRWEVTKTFSEHFVQVNPAACIPRQSGLRSACVFVPSRRICTRPRARLSANGLDAVSRKTGFHEKAVKVKVLFLGLHEFSTLRNGLCWQGRKGSHFHPNSLSPAVHGWIRSPCKGRSVTILPSGSPCGGSGQSPSSLQDQRPFKFFS
jgi:hypothetical protein